VFLLTAPVASRSQTWHRVGLPGVAISALASIDDSTVIASGPQSLYRSVDGGSTWTTTHPLGGFREISVGDGGFIVAVGNTTFARSLDGGSTWTVLRDQALRDSLGVPWTIAAGRESGHVAYMGTTDALLRSSDGGASWEERGVGLPETAPHIGTLAVGADGTIVAGSQGILGGNIYFAAPGADQWLPLYVRPQDESGEATAVAVAPSGTILAAISLKGIATTSDQGTRWNTATADLTDAEMIRAFAIRATDLYAITLKGKILHSTDDGATWTVMMNEGLASSGALALLPTPAGRLIAGTNDGIYELSAGATVDATTAVDAGTVSARSLGDGTLRLERFRTDGAVRLDLFDVMGRLVARGDMASGVSATTIGGPCPGVYLLRASQGRRVSVLSVVVP
jgi:photosystem II stability/assembly factor-like uncharacterized protein